MPAVARDLDTPSGINLWHVRERAHSPTTRPTGEAGCGDVRRHGYSAGIIQRKGKRECMNSDWLLHNWLEVVHK